MNDAVRRRGFSVADLFVEAGCVVIVLMMLHVVLDVAAKFLLNLPLPGTIEIVSAYYMVGVLFLPLGYVARENEHIYVELFTQKLSPRNLRRLEAAIGLVGGLSMAGVAWLTGLEAAARTASGERWETAASLIQVWPSRWILPVGTGVMAVYMIGAALGWFRRDPAP